MYLKDPLRPLINVRSQPQWNNVHIIPHLIYISTWKNGHAQRLPIVQQQEILSRYDLGSKAV